MYKVKILVLGPSKSGKTVIANHLAEATESSDGHYNPTQGCRILEFQVADVQLNGKKVNAEVELWDCSGDHKFESCWPAMARDVSGIVFVCNPDQLGHEAELESCGIIVFARQATKGLYAMASFRFKQLCDVTGQRYNYYVRQHGLRDTQCIVFEHRKAKDVEQRISLSGAIGKLNSVITSSDDDDEVNQIKNHFTTYLSKLFVVLSEKREEEEMTILNNR